MTRRRSGESRDDGGRAARWAAARAGDGRGGVQRRAGDNDCGDTMLRRHARRCGERGASGWRRPRRGRSGDDDTIQRRRRHRGDAPGERQRRPSRDTQRHAQSRVTPNVPPLYPKCYPRAFKCCPRAALPQMFPQSRFTPNVTPNATLEPCCPNFTLEPRYPKCYPEPCYKCCPRARPLRPWRLTRSCMLAGDALDAGRRRCDCGDDDDCSDNLRTATTTGPTTHRIKGR